MSGPVDHPEHYNESAVECIDAIDALVDGWSGRDAFYAGNILKYLWRHRAKNGVEDLKKPAGIWTG